MVVHVSYVSKHNEGQRNSDFREDSMEPCSSALADPRGGEGGRPPPRLELIFFFFLIRITTSFWS